MTLGHIKTYLIGTLVVAVMTVWSPSRPVFAERVPSAVDNQLVFNSEATRLIKQYDSTEASILTKVSIVDSQHVVLAKRIPQLKNLLNNDNTTEGVPIWWNRLSSDSFLILPQRMQLRYSYYNQH